MTRRGLKETDFKEIARIFADLILKKKNHLDATHEIKDILQEFPLFPLQYSFDHMLENDASHDLLREVLR
jgi:glycine hydroxymethyltransferase